MPRAMRTSWLKVASAAGLLSLMTCSEPVRSRYSPKFFEHDTAHSASGSSAHSRRSPKLSASTPSPSPW